MAEPHDILPPNRSEAMALATTARLLERVRQGDAAAREHLVSRFLPPFRRWAHGRLPDRARGLVDTDDLVQVALVKALTQMETFEPRHPGAFLGYLRRTLINEIRQELRRTARHPAGQALETDLPDAGPSPVERVVEREALEAYEAALARLSDTQRFAVLLRVELGFTYEQIALAIGSPTANASRMVVKRALLCMAEEMEHVRTQS